MVARLQRCATLYLDCPLTLLSSPSLRRAAVRWLYSSNGKTCPQLCLTTRPVSRLSYVSQCRHTETDVIKPIPQWHGKNVAKNVT
jgi:hypothetical protein